MTVCGRRNGYAHILRTISKSVYKCCIVRASLTSNPALFFFPFPLRDFLLPVGASRRRQFSLAIPFIGAAAGTSLSPSIVQPSDTFFFACVTSCNDTKAHNRQQVSPNNSFALRCSPDYQQHVPRYPHCQCVEGVKRGQKGVKRGQKRSKAG